MLTRSNFWIPPVHHRTKSLFQPFDQNLHVAIIYLSIAQVDWGITSQNFPNGGRHTTGWPSVESEHDRHNLPTSCISLHQLSNALVVLQIFGADASYQYVRGSPIFFHWHLDRVVFWRGLPQRVPRDRADKTQLGEMENYLVNYFFGVQLEAEIYCCFSIINTSKLLTFGVLTSRLEFVDRSWRNKF